MISHQQFTQIKFLLIQEIIYHLYRRPKRSFLDHNIIQAQILANRGNSLSQDVLIQIISKKCKNKLLRSQVSAGTTSLILGAMVQSIRYQAIINKREKTMAQPKKLNLKDIKPQVIHIHLLIQSYYHRNHAQLIGKSRHRQKNHRQKFRRMTLRHPITTKLKNQ